MVSVCGASIEYMSKCLAVNTLLGSRYILNKIYRNVDIEIEGRHLLANLVVFDMLDFDVILGVD